MRYDNVLTVDPGWKVSGWAWWEKLDSEHLRPDDSGVVRSESPLEHAREVEYVLWSHRHEIDRAFVEGQEYFGARHASTARGDMFKVAQAAGVWAGLIFTENSVFPEFIKPTVWKGQILKEVLHGLIEERLGRRYREHEADAVGIGLYLAGSLLPPESKGAEE